MYVAARLARLARQCIYERGIICIALFIYLAARLARLARQWILKELGIIVMRAILV